MKALTFSLLLAGFLCHSCQQEKQLPVTDNFNLIQLANGVYACTNKAEGKAICNSGIVDLGDATLVFDAFLSPIAAEELLQTIHTLGLPPVKYVVNSHYHNDHIRGNQVFPEDVQIISTPTTAELIREHEPQELEAEKGYAPVQLAFFDSLIQQYSGDTTARPFKSLKMWQAYFEVLTESIGNIRTRVPNTLFEKRKTVEGTHRNVELLCFGKGHTASDLVMYIPDQKIFFTGDLVFVGMHPYMADGYPKEWFSYLDTLQNFEIEHLVPGHGDVSTQAAIPAMKNYIKMIDQKARMLVDAGLPESSVDTLVIPAPYDTWWLDRFFNFNMHFMYNQLAGDSILIH